MDLFGIELVQTCGECPEQYDAYRGDEQVAYLRLRHGEFTVYYRRAFEELIFQAEPLGDGKFEDDEREAYLVAAVGAIKLRLLSADREAAGNTERSTPAQPTEVISAERIAAINSLQQWPKRHIPYLETKTDERETDQHQEEGGSERDGDEEAEPQEEGQ